MSEGQDNTGMMPPYSRTKPTTARAEKLPAETWVPMSRHAQTDDETNQELEDQAQRRQRGERPSRPR